MWFYSTSNRLSRLCLGKLVIAKQPRKKIHPSAILASKKFSIKGKSESSTRWLRRQAKVGLKFLQVLVVVQQRVSLLYISGYHPQPCQFEI
jgi:hypothetical protein